MFTREDTRMIKGIAVFLMLLHHMLFFSERLPLDFAYECSIMLQDKTLVRVLGEFGRICVSMFMFLGGYGLWCRRDQAGLLTKNIITLYKSYWKVFVIFIPIGFLFFGKQVIYCEEESICRVFSSFNFEQFLGNFIGWESTYNKEWWFFKAYLRTMLLGFLYVKYVKRTGFWAECLGVIILSVLTEDIFPGLASLECFERLGRDVWYLNFFTFGYTSCCFFVGIIFAKYDGITKMRMLFSEFRLYVRKILAVIGIVLLVYSWYFIIDEDMEMVYVPFLIVLCLELLDGIPVLQRMWRFLGAHSTNMWLTHSFFCYYFYPFVKLTHISVNPWIDLLILIGLSLGASLIVECFWKWIGKVCKPVLYQGEL